MKSFHIEHIDGSWYLIEGAPLGPRICGAARSREALLAEFVQENLPECSFRLKYETGDEAQDEAAIYFRILRGESAKDGHGLFLVNSPCKLGFSLQRSELVTKALLKYTEEKEPFVLECEVSECSS